MQARLSSDVIMNMHDGGASFQMGGWHVGRKGGQLEENNALDGQT